MRVLFFSCPPYARVSFSFFVQCVLFSSLSCPCHRIPHMPDSISPLIAVKAQEACASRASVAPGSTGAFARIGVFRAGRLLAALLLTILCLAPEAVLADVADSRAFAHVFNTVSLRRPMKVFPFWVSVLDKNAKHPVFSEQKDFRGVSWAKMREKASTLRGLDLLTYVNTFWNRYPYIEDIVNWKKEDYWAAPYEFLDKSGDCEDYAIVKYMTLRKLGVSADRMRILVVRDTFRNLAHAVLGVEEGGRVYILDNVSNAILAHTRLSQYIPQYSVNEDNAWMHIRAKKK